MQQVVLDHAGLVVGDVLELVVGADVAERKDAGHRLAAREHALPVVDHDAAVVVQVVAGVRDGERVGVGDAAEGDEHGLRLDEVARGEP